MASRGKTWNDDGTKTLISLWGEENIQVALDQSKTTKQSSAIYSSIWVKLQQKGFTEFSLKEVINKIKKLRQKYRSEKDKCRKSGNGTAMKKWKYFDSIDRFLAKRHSVTPPVVYDTMAESLTVASGNVINENENTDDELVKKYGRGKITTKKCNTCSYEQNIHSDGVHLSENGTVKVYAEEDVFSCPNCDQFAILDENQLDMERPEKESSSVQLPSDVDACPKPSKQTQKKKRKTNVEKSLEVVFQKFQETANSDFLRYQSLEEDRQRKEHKFHLQQITLENERRREEREHELNMMRMFLSPTLPTPPTSSTLAFPSTYNESTETDQLCTYYQL